MQERAAACIQWLNATGGVALDSPLGG